MSDKPLPSFRAIAAPLDVEDALLDRVNDSLGVPRMVKPGREADAPSPPPPAAIRAPVEKLTIEIPDYLLDAIKRTALDRKSTARHVVMAAMKVAGFAIDDADLVEDGRRGRGQAKA